MNYILVYLKTNKAHSFNSSKSYALIAFIRINYYLLIQSYSISLIPITGNTVFF